MLPDNTCVQDCTTKFKALEAQPKAFYETDLVKDSLIDDMGKSVSVCGQNNSTDMATKMTCAASNLATLKSKYNYIN